MMRKIKRKYFIHSTNMTQILTKIETGFYFDQIIKLVNVPSFWQYDICSKVKYIIVNTIEYRTTLGPILVKQYREKHSIFYMYL